MLIPVFVYLISFIVTKTTCTTVLNENVGMKKLFHDTWHCLSDSFIDLSTVQGTKIEQCGPVYADHLSQFQSQSELTNKILYCNNVHSFCVETKGIYIPHQQSHKPNYMCVTNEQLYSHQLHQNQYLSRVITNIKKTTIATKQGTKCGKIMGKKKDDDIYVKCDDTMKCVQDPSMSFNYYCLKRHNEYEFQSYNNIKSKPICIEKDQFKIQYIESAKMNIKHVRTDNVNNECGIFEQDPNDPNGQVVYYCKDSPCCKFDSLIDQLGKATKIENPFNACSQSHFKAENSQCMIMKETRDGDTSSQVYYGTRVIQEFSVDAWNSLPYPLHCTKQKCKRTEN